MLNVRNSALEDARLYPEQYVQSLLIGGARRNIGMFSRMQNVIVKVHAGALTVSDARKQIESQFLLYETWKYNKTKQDRLLASFDNYFASFDKMKLQFVDSKHQMKWQLHANVSLSGLTPIVVANNSGYYSYIFTEQPIDEWKKQLRFPLIQQYLANNTIGCDATEVNVGVFCASSGTFEFKSFSKREIAVALKETAEVFNTVDKTYSKLKK